MSFLPLFHRVKGKRCLVVGGGKVALRRATVLESVGMSIDVVATELSSDMADLAAASGGVVMQQEYRSEDISSDYFLIVAATDVREVNAAVTDFARANSILLNVADAHQDCDVVFPSLVTRDSITVAISNSGFSPVLSRLLKEQIDAYLPKTYGDLSTFVGQYRTQVTQAIPDVKMRVRFWENVLQGSIAQQVLAGKHNQAEQSLVAAIDAPQAFCDKGEVYLIGAGPGALDLLTLRAFRLIQHAEVVLYDRLVSPEILALTKPQAEHVYVGKQRANHSVPQGNINQLLVKYAKQGKRVARLKGGDPFVFGRGGEELETLVDEEIPFQVVPGITAASGCSSYAGIPLTHRDYAQSVQFVAGQMIEGSIQLNWSELAVPGKTVVFYMGLKTLPIICQQLIDHGLKASTPVALVEKGTTNEQRVVVSNLTDLPNLIDTLTVVSPSLLIVGEVVSLSEKLSWFNVSD